MGILGGIVFILEGKWSKAAVYAEQVEDTCIQQIMGFLNNPTFTNNVAIMPDTHFGKGAVIGFTMEMTDRIIPNVVGVDIGCGLLSFNMGPNILDKFSKIELDQKIRQAIPFGTKVQPKAVIHLKNEFPWNDINSEAQKLRVKLSERLDMSFNSMTFDSDYFSKKCKQIGIDLSRAINSLASAGGGNHFIEIGKAEETGDYWITLHSGSRNLGKCIAEYHQKKAVKQRTDVLHSPLYKQQIEYIRANTPKKDIEKELKELKDKVHQSVGDKDLVSLSGPDMWEYLFDMIFAQKYAQVNRKYMMKQILEIFKGDVKDQIESVHNFIDFNDFIIRKGAIRSYVGERMIIPFNMMDGLIIAEGKSNPEWNFSAPHGAGRVLSRSAAKKQLDMEEFKDQMKDIFSTSVCLETLDEAPGAYKDAEMIKRLIEPTAKILFNIKPVHNMKDKKGEKDDG